MVHHHIVLLNTYGRIRPDGRSPHTLIFVPSIPSIDIQDAAERTPIFEKRINLKPKKLWKCFFYFWKACGMPFYINVFQTKHHSTGGLEY